MVQMTRHVENPEPPVQEKSGLRRLVELFPGATPMRIRICVVVPRGRARVLEEKTELNTGLQMVFDRDCVGIG